MFSVRQATAAELQARIEAAADLPRVEARFLIDGTHDSERLPFFFARDVSISPVGRGKSGFAAARQAFAQWTMFDLGWVRVANPDARICPGQLVAVEACTLGLWTLNVSRIVEVIDTLREFGFLYSTTEMHVEEGEERFLLEFDPESGEVNYRLEAISRPRHNLARLGYPITRMFQQRFARDSHLRMKALLQRAS